MDMEKPWRKHKAYIMTDKRGPVNIGNDRRMEWAPLC